LRQAYIEMLRILSIYIINVYPNKVLMAFILNFYKYCNNKILLLYSKWRALSHGTMVIFNYPLDNVFRRHFVDV